ncbi:MAG: M20 family peptidase, partial [Gammaproteobacteria bacterium]|nr:M20 family peptidase [Gammaproteobacteria bacterium]
MGAFYRSFLVLFLLFGAELVTADLTELENRIIAIAERDKESAIALLARTVNINSGTMNHLGVKAVGEVFAEEFQHLGLTTTWHDMSEVNRAGHLFAETAGESGSRCLLLIGHLDTVFELD